jgi:dTDP-4-dehydrorhamnose reductase
VNTILVVGVESVVGANLAAHLADRYSIIGLCAADDVRIEGCDVERLVDDEARDTSRWLRSARPDWLVYCGPESSSAWNGQAARQLTEGSAGAAGAWAAAAHAAQCPFTMISSDAVFTGPWMFHDEESLAVCRTPEAARIREAEKSVREQCPAALIVRTNAFGWSVDGDHGWIESQLAAIESRRGLETDCIRHATPLLATDLADILERARQEQLSGTYHVAGAERVSPTQFAQRLADQFDLPWLSVRREQSLLERPEGFGAGETSLQTKKVRKALCVAMPMLSEGLGRLQAQQINGFRDRLCPSGHGAVQKVA